jgi:ornithine decarboxylase
MTCETITHTLPVFDSIQDIIIRNNPDKPILCFSPTVVQDRVRIFKERFPGIIAWAVKSNPHHQVLDTVVNAGIMHFDIASKEEIDIVQAVCPNAVLHFSHPAKSPEDIEYAWISGVRSFAVDCMDEVEKISGVLEANGILKRSAVTLLVRFYDQYVRGSDHYNFNVKFGTSPEEAVALLIGCKKLGYKVGLTFHSGSQNCRPETYRTMMYIAHDIWMAAFHGEHQEMYQLNIGGGFPCPYPGSDNPPLSEYFKEIQLGAMKHVREIMCEPGRIFVAEAASLLTRVTLRRNGENCLYINDGIYGSFRELSYVPLMPPARAYRADGTLISTLDVPSQPFQIWGPTCDSLDGFRESIYLPSTIQTGDFIEWGMMGAYSTASATQFNGFQPAKLVQIKRLASWNQTDQALSPLESNR